MKKKQEKISGSQCFQVIQHDKRSTHKVLLTKSKMKTSRKVRFSKSTDNIMDNAALLLEYIFKLYD